MANACVHGRKAASRVCPKRGVVVGEESCSLMCKHACKKQVGNTITLADISAAALHVFASCFQLPGVLVGRVFVLLRAIHLNADIRAMSVW